MKKLIVSVLVLGSLYSSAQIDRSIRPTAAAAPKINIAEPVTFKLDNGIKVIVSENHKQPKVSVNIVMGSDPYYSTDKAGLTSLVSDLMMSGTEKRTKDELDNEIDFIGAYLSASSTNVYLSCLTKHMDKGMDLMTDIINNASFPESEFERIKKQYESGLLSAKSDPASMASNAEGKALFPNHPKSMVMTEESLEAITRDDVINFYKTRFTPSEAYLVIVGDITPTAAKELAQKNFGSWKGTPAQKAKYPKGNFITQNRVVFVEKPGAVQSVITIAQPINMMPGAEDQIKLSVMNKILGGGGFGTRLMQNLREDKAYTYGAYTSLNVGRTGSSISASGNFRNEVTDSAIVEFLYEFKRITAEKVTEEELELNKAAMAGSFARSLESPQTIARFALNTYRNELPADYYANYLKRLSEVSKDDVLAVANKYINPNGLYIIVVGSKDVLANLMQFDADGKIEMLDAFGNDAVKIEYKDAGIAKTELLEKHLIAVTGTKNLKKAKKALKKVKTVQQELKITIEGAPVELTLKSYFSEGKRMSKVVYGPMTINHDYFDGEKGGSKQMNQTGGQDESMLTAEEVAKHKKFMTFLPEQALLNGNVAFDILGAIEEDGKNLIVIKYEGEKGQVTAYYDAATYMKVKSTTLVSGDEGSVESTSKFNDYKMVGKLMFPYTVIQVMGPQVFKQEVQNIEVNGKIDDSKFAL